MSGSRFFFWRDVQISSGNNAQIWQVNTRDASNNLAESVAMNVNEYSNGTSDISFYFKNASRGWVGKSLQQIPQLNADNTFTGINTFPVSVTTATLSTNIPGITVAISEPGLGDECRKVIRVANLVVVNLALSVTGTFTGTTGWQTLVTIPNFDMNLKLPGIISVSAIANNTITRINLLSGFRRYLTNGVTYNERYEYQLIAILA